MNPVKLVLGIAISLIGLGGYLHIAYLWNEPYLEEPTHIMTAEEMKRVCIEEGIPLD